MEQMDIEKSKKSKILDSFPDFQMAVSEAQLTGLDHLEVTHKLFKSLTKGVETNYLTWGHPGVKVFPEGTMKGILEDEKMDAETHREIAIKAKSRK